MKKLTFFTLAAALVAGTSAVWAATDLALSHVKRTTAHGGREGLAVAAGSSINTSKVSALTLTLTNPTLAAVPEPSTYTAAAVGALALGTVLLRRNRRPAGL